LRAVGVDGCRGGWLAVPREGGYPVVHATFADLLRAEPRATLAVDVPIGLLDMGRTGDRACDKAARRLLGFPRRASVFPPPLRSRLHASERPPEMGAQSFAILPKVREVDALLAPALQARCVEAHPELAFTLLAGRPMRHAKRAPEGKTERRRALGRIPGRPFARLRDPPRGAAVDDLLDACVLAWTAARVAQGESLRLPDSPPVDSRGLRMEIHA
jgi:predicted RNase H-like nuclease